MSTQPSPLAPSPWVPVMPPQDAGAAPAPVPVNMSGPAPVFAPTPAPQVTRTPTVGEQQINNDQQQLQKVRWNQANPWGSVDNHPGTMGKIAHVLSVAGNIAGDIFAPATMMNIPGTEMNMKMNEAGLTHRLNSEVAQNSENEARDQQTAEEPQKAADEHAQSSALTRKAIAESDALDNKPTPEPTLANAYAHAVNQAIKEGRDPAQDPIVSHLSDAITSLQKQPAAPKMDYQTTVGPDGKPHVYGLDAKGNKVADEGVHYEKPNVTNINSGDAALDREAKQFGGPHQKSLDAAQSQLEKIADARSMINGSAEAQALGVPKVLTALVGGQGTGVRITTPELNAIAHARGLQGDVEGTLSSWSGKGKLTSAQQQQMTAIMDDVKARILEKQAIASGALDSINGATNRGTIIQADKDARQKLNDLETHGHYAGQTVQLKNGQSVVLKAVHPNGDLEY